MVERRRNAVGAGERSVEALSLRDLGIWISQCPPAQLPTLAEQLSRDPRRGARPLAERARRRWESLRLEHRRFQVRFRYERRLWRQGYRWVAGVDEVGRGPLAGPVVAAAVILDADVWLPGLDDSKALTARARQRLAEEIRRQAVAVAVGVASVEEIDRLNIFHASQLAMRRAIADLRPQPDYLLVDGWRLREVDLPQWPIVGGDAVSNSVAAASIVAKVYRDALMVELDRAYPGYGFAQHKGYPTPDHRAALARLGPCPIHRRHFRLV
ncbi:MAG TPA: ribonuclease HII [Bacillota bacterium]